jgi:hypothetical protein
MKVENPFSRRDEVGFVQIVDSRNNQNRGDMGDLRIFKIVRPPAVNVMVKQGCTFIFERRRGNWFRSHATLTPIRHHGQLRCRQTR